MNWGGGGAPLWATAAAVVESSGGVGGVNIPPPPQQFGERGIPTPPKTFPRKTIFIMKYYKNKITRRQKTKQNKCFRGLNTDCSRRVSLNVHGMLSGA
jgi:hypothetical protein